VRVGSRVELHDRGVEIHSVGERQRRAAAEMQVAAGEQTIVHEKELDIFIRDAEGHAAVRPQPGAHTADGQRRHEGITHFDLGVAAIERHAGERLDKRVEVAAVNVGLRRERREQRADIHTRVQSAAILAGCRIAHRVVVVAGNRHRKRRRHNDSLVGQVVTKRELEVLERGVIVAGIESARRQRRAPLASASASWLPICSTFFRGGRPRRSR
jgi:hypothetical protein